MPMPMPLKRPTILPVPSRRKLWCLAALARLLCQPVVSATQETKAAPVRGTPRISIDLGSGSIGGVLPFDEPLELAGVPSPTLQSLRVVYGERLDTIRQACTVAGIATRTQATEGEGRGKPDTAAVANWIRRSASADSFRLRLQALRPNRDFGFCFHTVSTLSAEDSTRFVNSVRAAIQQRARKWVQTATELSTVSDVALRELAEELRNTLDGQVKGRYQLRIPPTSILADTPSTVAISEAFAAFENANCDRLRLVRQLMVQALVDPATGLPEVHAARCPGANAKLTEPGVTTFASTLAAIAVAPLLTAFEEEVSNIPETRLPPAKARAVVELLTRLRIAKPRDLGDVAFGRASLDNPLSPVAGIAAPERIAQSIEVLTWRSNLAVSAERINDLLLATEILREKGHAESTGGARRRYSRSRESSIVLPADSLATLLRLAYSNLRMQQDNLRQFVEALDALGAAGSGIADGVIPSQLATVLLEGTTFGSYQTRARWHISQDIGVLYGWHPDDARIAEPYAGLNVYFAPVNKNAHVGPGCAFSAPLKCISATLGVTMSNVDEADRFKGVLGGKAAVVGVGTRVGDFLRLSYLRPIVYSSSNSQPKRRRVAALHAFSISIDADLKELLGAVGNALFN